MTEAEKKKAWDMLAAKWGEGLSEEDYKALETSYRSMASDYKGAISPRLELNLIDISKWRLERDKCVKSGDTAAAKRYTDMIRATMDSEAMKVGDTKPTEAMRADGLAQRLEELNLLKDGTLVLKNVIEYIQNDRGSYQISRDAIDLMMLSMTNAYRFNNGLSEIPELPEDMRIQDKLGEFLETPTMEEKNTMLELGMVPNKRGDS